MLITRRVVIPQHVLLNAETTMHDQQFIPLAQVMDLTGLAEAAIRELISARRFPSSINITPQDEVWIAGDILRWNRARIAENRRRYARQQPYYDRSQLDLVRLIGEARGATP